MVHTVSSGRHGPLYDDADIVGPGPWEPILPEGPWRAVYAVLRDPSRRNAPGAPPSYPGPLIYPCGKCADGIRLLIGDPEQVRPGIPVQLRAGDFVRVN